MLAAGGSSKCCTIFDNSWHIVSDIQRSASVASVKWNPDGSQVANSCSDGTVAVVDLKSKRMVNEVVRRVIKAAFQINDDMGSISSINSHMGGHAKVNSLCCWSPTAISARC